MHNLTWNRSICCAAAVILPPHAIIVFLPERKWNHDVLFSVWRSSPPQGAPDGICARAPATHRVRGIFTALFAQWEWPLSLNQTDRQLWLWWFFCNPPVPGSSPSPAGIGGFLCRICMFSPHLHGDSVYSSFLPLSTCVDITVTIGEKESRFQPDKCNFRL